MNEQSKKYFEKLKAHLPMAKDPTTVILRGHLLVEELLDEIISVNLKEPTAVKDARLTFYQKMRLAQGFIGIGAQEFTWKPIEELNKLRNQVGHKLPDTALISKLDNVLKAFFEDEFGEISNNIYSKSKALRKGIIFHCAFLSGRIDSMKYFKKANE
jgi:hypothetical protein